MEKIEEEKLLKVFFGEYSINELKEVINSGVVFSSLPYSISNLKKQIVRFETNSYREVVDCLSVNNMFFASILEKERYEYVKKRIESIDENGIFRDLYNKTKEELKLILPESAFQKVSFELNKNNSIDSILKNYTNKCLYEYIVDLYFKDIAFNYLHNLKTIVTYIDRNSKCIIPEERLSLYRNILNFEKLSLDEKKKLFYSYDVSKQYLYDFYSDFCVCKNDCYESINNSIISKENLNKVYNEDTSNLYDVNIYELEGEEFYLYAHSTKIDSDTLEFPFKKNSNNKTLSISLIGSENVTIYKPVNYYITIGFSYLSPNNIMHLFNSDSYTKSLSGTTKFQRVYTSSELLQNTYGYNEILYKMNGESIYPFCIICFDEIKPIELFFAKKENLPIVKINTKKYKKSPEIEDMYENIYLDSSKAKEIEFYGVYF